MNQVSFILHQLNKWNFDLKFLQMDHNINPLYQTLNKRLNDFIKNLLAGGKVPKQKDVIQNYIDNIMSSL